MNDNDIDQNYIYIDEKAEELDEILSYYRGCKDPGQDTLVELLREIQELSGYIGEEQQAAAADAMGVNQAVIVKLIKLYPSLKARPSSHRIVVCTGVSCGSHGSELLDAVYREVRNRPSGLFTITTRNCMKQCRTSPNFTIDGRLMEGVRPEEVAGILDKFGPLS